MQNILRENNEKILYDGDKMLNVLKEIEYMLISLHKMGSYYCDKDIMQYEKETTQFIDNAEVCGRLANIRKTLSEKFDLELGEDEMDDIERACEDIPYWRKPGDYTSEKWLV